ncbi:MAG: sigma-70 family RNA polymerase sigma factor [Acidobacteria bacterium]|nr:sigma-70 family RNA polymerase sigma factor [Acidobacteriota bacterium]
MKARAEITEILKSWRSGDEAAAETLYSLVYEELRRLARSLMRRERAEHTLQPTALVHEAYLRLIDQQTDWQSRAHFYGIAAQMMRRILVNHARDRRADKRGGPDRFQISLTSAENIGAQKAVDVLALDEALVNLEKFDPRKSRVVELRFFGGLTEREIAEILQVNEKTIRRDWTMAKMWLHRELSENEG